MLADVLLMLITAGWLARLVGADHLYFLPYEYWPRTAFGLGKTLLPIRPPMSRPEQTTNQEPFTKLCQQIGARGREKKGKCSSIRIQQKPIAEIAISYDSPSKVNDEQ